MTPKPPPSSDGSALPPRHRPNMGNLAKDTTEMDLWAFDDLDPIDELPAPELPTELKPTIPEPKNPEGGSRDLSKSSSKPGKSGSPPAASGSDNITVSVNKKTINARPTRKAQGPAGSAGHSAPGRDFEDLDQWEETLAPKSLEKMPLRAESESIEPEAGAPAPNRFREMPSPKEVEMPEGSESTAPHSVPAPEDDRDEFSTKARGTGESAFVRPKLNLTRVERIGLAALVAIILIAGGVFYFNTISRLPTGTERAKPNDFPIKGSLATVTSAITFWRTPVSSGENPDTVRRDTLLIPVVGLATSGGPAAIRVFFRDGTGELIGDAVSRSVQGDLTFEIAATAGFDDLGQHAAYRTGQGKPWTVEVLEAPSANSPTEAFKKLFEMNISTDRR